MCDAPRTDRRCEDAGKRTKASLILFVASATVVLADLVGAICVEADAVAASDQLVLIALLSVPLILVLLVIGAVLGTLEWHVARKASRRPSPMTVVAATRFGRDTSPDDPIWTSMEEYMQLDRRGGRKPPVTRREIADLGNMKSGLVRRLVASLKRAHDGYRQFGRLGLVGHPPTESDWSRSSPAALSRYLKPTDIPLLASVAPTGRTNPA